MHKENNDNLDLNNENIGSDSNNDCFYSELYILGLTFHFNKFNKSEILQVTNNVVSSVINPAGKCGAIDGKPVIPCELTNLFHRYYVSFLLVNGVIYDFIEVGVFEDNYNDSVALSHKFSEYLNIPVFVCKNGNIIKKSKLIGDGYVLEATKIGYVSDLEKVAGVLFCYAFLITVTIILACMKFNLFASLIILMVLIAFIFCYIKFNKIIGFFYG